ncbi:eukaryotic translation initiation factor 3 subunit I-like [Panonychus citri]|uniref:eukaryotic translation initiation factor 3 subunit I-like n=1 Tax=Panonychus citri TaxID=50023 RepID=UPI002307C3B7|nr:eukaryotic translation initiation factor 3 subunit I-like [Panonychus citri]
MKPLALQGHERAITQIKYNHDGDLLFSCAKDANPNVWYSVNGERLGTLDGHAGVVWTIDCNWDSTKVVTGSGDNSLNLWDLEYGKVLSKFASKNGIRVVGFSNSGKQIFFTTDKTMNLPSQLRILDINDPDQFKGNSYVFSIADMGVSKPTAALWGPLDESIITGHENGTIIKWDLRTTTSSLQEVPEVHRGQINDMQYNNDQTMLITASKDTTSKIFDTETLEHLKTYRTERPVNSAAISPIRDHVVVGGGQEAMDVTTTAARAGKFEARFFHLIFEEEFARVKGHFGPINSLAFHPDGKSYASGGEDGYVRVQNFDQSYFDFHMDV